MSARQRIVDAVLAVGFIAATTAVWVAHPPRAFAIFPAVVCFVLLILAVGIRFESPLGDSIPTQLAFVPLVFAVPLAVVPIAVAATLLLRRLPAVLKHEVSADRLLTAATGAWFSLGPVGVFVVAGVAPRHASATLLLAALLAQFLASYCQMTVQAVERCAGLASLLRDTWVYAVDAALSGVGLLVARQIEHARYAPLALLPLLVLFAFFARERHERLANVVELGGPDPQGLPIVRSATA